MGVWPVNTGDETIYHLKSLCEKNYKDSEIKKAEEVCKTKH